MSCQHCLRRSGREAAKGGFLQGSDNERRPNSSKKRRRLASKAPKSQRGELFAAILEISAAAATRLFPQSIADYRSSSLRFSERAGVYGEMVSDLPVHPITG